MSDWPGCAEYSCECGENPRPGARGAGVPSGGMRGMPTANDESSEDRGIGDRPIKIDDSAF